MKKFKGFTLIELIIVMAIFGILMTGIVQMMKPIRSTYVDSTLYESQRSAQNGIVTYISESIRYATDLGFYTNDKVSDPKGAVDKFTAAYIAANGITDSTEISNVTANIAKKAEVIVIDNASNYDYNGEKWYGRILRRKVDDTALTAISSGAADYVSKSSEWRLALGAAYYGERNCTIRIEDGDTSNKDASNQALWNASDGIKITVTTTKTGGFDRRNSESQGIISVTGEVLCRNLDSGSVGSPGMLDLANATNTASPSGSQYPYVLPTAPNTKIFIVYLNKDVPKDTTL